MPEKLFFFARCSWFELKNLGPVLGMALKLYMGAGKELKLKVRKFSGLLPIFGEITGEKLVGEQGEEKGILPYPT